MNATRTFFEALKADELVRDYTTLTSAISALMAPKDKDAGFTKKVGGSGAFPLMAHVGMGAL